jgi:hypothetical protein
MLMLFLDILNRGTRKEALFRDTADILFEVEV